MEVENCNMCYDYTSLHFLLYVGRWILSAIVMMAPLYFIKKYTTITNEYVHLIMIQIIGAFIFYQLDAYLFR